MEVECASGRRWVASYSSAFYFAGDPVQSKMGRIGGGILDDKQKRFPHFVRKRKQGATNEFEIQVIVFRSDAAGAGDREWLHSNKPPSRWAANAAATIGDHRESPSTGRARVP